MPDTTGDITKSAITFLRDKNGRIMGVVIDWYVLATNPALHSKFSDLWAGFESNARAIVGER